MYVHKYNDLFPHFLQESMLRFCLSFISSYYQRLDISLSTFSSIDSYVLSFKKSKIQVRKKQNM